MKSARWTSGELTRQGRKGHSFPPPEGEVARQGRRGHSFPPPEGEVARQGRRGRNLSPAKSSRLPGSAGTPPCGGRNERSVS